jgi:NAD(P)-dependent dehydrogenase (short-subunit alcohol dehydrogenase family)
MNFEDVVAIVTGGFFRLGGASAAMLAAKGAKVSILDLNAEAGSMHASEICG